MDTSLVKNVTFKKYNLLSGSTLNSFSAEGFHVVLCRNVLIYFTNDQQLKIVSFIHQNLVHKGYFIIGANESILWDKDDDRFMAVSNKSRIFKKMK